MGKVLIATGIGWIGAEVLYKAIAREDWLLAFSDAFKPCCAMVVFYIALKLTGFG